MTYLDKATLYWLRATGRQPATASSSASRIVVDFSNYGKAVSITAPRV